MQDWLSEISGYFYERHKKSEDYICRKEIVAFTDKVVNLLFPSRCEKKLHSMQDWADSIQQIQQELLKILEFLDEKDIEKKCTHFLKTLPHLKPTLDADAIYFTEQDPAAESLVEVLICYPGFLALAMHRIAHELYKLDIALLPRIISEYAHEKTGVDIHPGAKLLSPIFIDHGTGIVVGETCEIGHHVNIFQGVTLGAPSVQKKLSGSKRHPTVGNHVILYANATILGGDTVIGHNSIIGGNVWITKSVPENSRIYYQPDRKKPTSI